MKRKIPALPQVLLVVFVALFLSWSFVAAGGEDDDKECKPPIDTSDGGPGDHGGGDPDNPVPMLGGTGSEHIVDVGLAYASIYVGADEGSLGRAEFLRLVKIITSVLGSTLGL